MKPSRQSNLELLRILAALSVVSYHLFAQSGAFGPENSNHFLFSVWLGGGGRIACSIFVMIGAYFLVDSSFRIQRIIRLWLKVMIAAILINGVVYLIDPTIFSAANWGLLLSQFFPILGRPYWFVSDYIVLLAISPFLNAVVHSDNLHKYLKWVLFCSIVAIWVLSLFPEAFKRSIFYNDLIWFCFLYIFIGYIKKHSTSRLLAHKYLFLCTASLSYSLICFLTITFDWLKDTWPYAWEIRFFYMSTYQSILGFVCAFSVFQYFLKLEIGSQKLINCISSHAVGIYIMHQVPILYINGWMWTDIFHINRYFETSEFNVVCIGTILIVAVTSICLDALCDFIINPLIHLKSVDSLCLRFNTYVCKFAKS